MIWWFYNKKNFDSFSVCFQANELLQAARASQDPLQREQHLRQALHLLKGVAQPLNLGVLSPQMASLQFYLGVVELGLHEARKADPQGLALHFYQSGEPQEDIQGMQAYIARWQIHWEWALDWLHNLVYVVLVYYYDFPSINTFKGRN